MDFDATQIIDGQRTSNSNNDDEKTRIGTLRIGNAEYEIVEGYNKIGRSPLCKVVLSDPTVSKIHAEIQAGLEATFICDLKSANGTTFKGLSLKPFFFYPINDGEAVYLGQVKAVYEIAKPSEQKIDTTPKKSVESRTHDGDRKSTSSSIEDDRLFDDSGESMVPGTERKEKKRLFRLPEIPIDRQKSKLESNRNTVVGEFEEVKEMDKNHEKTDSTNIHEMETQKIADLVSVHEPEAPKRPRMEKSPSVLDDSIENSIYDAETQVSIARENPIVKSKNLIIHDEDSNTDEENPIGRNLRPSKPHLIAETDDESGTDDEVANVVKSGLSDHISDDSITDGENEFESIATSMAQKKKQGASSCKNIESTAKKLDEPDAEIDINEAATQRLIEPREIEGRNSPQLVSEMDVDLLPTQILDVATSTPMMKQAKGGINVSDERLEDDDDLFGAPTQVLFELPVDKADSSLKISHMDDSDECKLDSDDQDLHVVPTQIIDIPDDEANSSGKISRLDGPDDKKIEKNDQDLHDAPTQSFDIPAGKADLRSKLFGRNYSRKSENKMNDQDLHDAPTQIFDVSVSDLDSSRELSGLNDSGKEKPETNEQDLHDAPTQALDVPVDKVDLRVNLLRLNRFDKRDVGTKDQDLHDAPTQASDISPGKAVSRSNILRLNRVGKRKLETNDQDLHDAPTQIFDVPACKTDSSSKMPRLQDAGKSKLETDDQDLHDAPTQIINVPVGKTDSISKMARLRDAGKNKLETDDQDLHDAPTQISDDPVGKTDSISKMARIRDAGKNKLETNDQDLHDAPTQISDDPVGEADSIPKITYVGDTGKRKLKTNDQDLCDESMQAFELPAGKTDLRSKMLKRNNSRKFKLKVNDQEDLDDAPTQTFSVPDSKKDKSKEIEESPKRKEKNKNENEKVNLDDTISRNLGDIFGDDGNNENDLMGPSTPMLTQNLMDILRPTQSFAGSSPIRDARQTPRSNIDEILLDETIDNLPKSPNTRKKTTNSAGTLGFVDGQAVRSQKEFLSAPSLTKQRGTRDEVEKAPGAKIEYSASSHQSLTGCDEEDDILSGLPEVKLYGTLSNPGSPASSSTSSHNDLVLPSTKIIDNEIVKKVSARSIKGSQRRAANLRSSIDDNVEKFDSDESESPIEPIKFSRGKRKFINRIVDDDEDRDSDDSFDYNKLKKIAEKLLASDVTADTRLKSDNENLASRWSRVRKNIETKKVTVKNQRTRKLSKKSLSLIVPDTNSELSDDEGENKNLHSTRSGKIGDVTTKKIISTAIERESKKSKAKNAIVGPVDKKTYATVQLTRLRENDVLPKNLDRPKATRSRRVTSISKELTTSPNPPARPRGRRTLGDTAESRGSLVDERHNILFTGIKDEDYERIVTKLGGSVVSDPPKATVLISDKIRRTFKFLCSMAQGIKIVSIKWLTESNKAGRFLDCENFVLQDPMTEAKFKFKLAKSLQIAQGKKLLDGYTVFVTPKVNQPEIHELKGMIEACGGRVLVRPTRSWDPKTVIISREDDLTAAKVLLSKAPKSVKITVQSTEFILTGILRQEINLLEHKLI